MSSNERKASLREFYGQSIKYNHAPKWVFSLGNSENWPDVFCSCNIPFTEAPWRAVWRNEEQDCRRQSRQEQEALRGGRTRWWVRDMHGELCKNGAAKLWTLHVHQLLPWLVSPTASNFILFFVPKSCWSCSLKYGLIFTENCEILMDHLISW